MSQPSKPTLADLRVEIDRIDSEMHELLIERGRDQLIEIKTAAVPFRLGQDAVHLVEAELGESCQQLFNVSAVPAQRLPPRPRDASVHSARIARGGTEGV